MRKNSITMVGFEVKYEKKEEEKYRIEEGRAKRLARV